MTVAVLVDRPEYNIRGEFLWFGVVLHSDVHVRWSRDVWKQFRSDMMRLREISPEPLWAFQTPSHDPKKRKFIKAVGGVFHHYRITPSGERAEMFLFPALDFSKGTENG